MKPFRAKECVFARIYDAITRNDELSAYLVQICQHSKHGEVSFDSNRSSIAKKLYSSCVKCISVPEVLEVS